MPDAADAPHLPPISDARWPEELAPLRDSFATGLNVYRVMAHHPALLTAWAPLRDHLVRHSTLGPERAEIVVLRTGYRMRSNYEWAQHVHRARELGMTDARIASVRGPLDAMAPDDATLAGAVDALFDAREVPRPLQAEVVKLAGAEGLIDLIATVGFYVTLGGLLNSFDVPLDDDVAAALDRDPPPS